MVTLGKATTAAVQQQISALGTNILQVRPGQGFGRGGGGPRPPDFEAGGRRRDPRRRSPASPRSRRRRSRPRTAIYEGANWSTTINGTTGAYFDGPALAAGRRAASSRRPRKQAGKAVCIIGNTVRSNLFRGGERGRHSGCASAAISCDVIGVLSTRGQAGFGGDQDDVVIMPIKAVQRRFTGNRDIRLMLVGVDQAYSTAGGAGVDRATCCANGATSPAARTTISTSSTPSRSATR